MVFKPFSILLPTSSRTNISLAFLVGHHDDKGGDDSSAVPGHHLLCYIRGILETRRMTVVVDFIVVLPTVHYKATIFGQTGPNTCAHEGTRMDTGFRDAYHFAISGPPCHRYLLTATPSLEVLTAHHASGIRQAGSRQRPFMWPYSGSTPVDGTYVATGVARLINLPFPYMLQY